MGPELERNEGRLKGMELQANPHLNTNLALSAPSPMGSLPTREGSDPRGRGATGQAGHLRGSHFSKLWISLQL